jgi:hypothetical protein
MKYLLYVRGGEGIYPPFEKYQSFTCFRLFFSLFLLNLLFTLLLPLLFGSSLLLISISKGLSIASPIYWIFPSFQGIRSLVFDFNSPLIAPSHIIKSSRVNINKALISRTSLLELFSNGTVNNVLNYPFRFRLRSLILRFSASSCGSTDRDSIWRLLQIQPLG